MDEIKRPAIRDEGYDPDDRAVIAAIDLVRAALAAVGGAVVIVKTTKGSGAERRALHPFWKCQRSTLESPSSASSQHLRKMSSRLR